MTATADVVPIAGFRDGERHGWLNTFCGQLEQMAVGAAAAAAAADVDGAASRAVVALPMWLWARPAAAAKVGRKARAHGGGTLLLPVRVRWSTPLLLTLKAGETVTSKWTATGLGHAATGTVTVTAYAPTRAQPPSTSLSDLREAFATGWADSSTVSKIPSSVAAPTVSHAVMRSQLRAAAGLGRDARWEALMAFEKRMVSAAVRRAHASVCAEIAESTGRDVPALLDETALDQVASELVLGAADSDTPSAVQRMLDRCLVLTFERVEPLHYVTTTLRRDAEYAVRGWIGDPHIGRKVRSVAGEIGTFHVQAVVDAYTERWPRDRLAGARAQAALSVAPDPMARTVPLPAVLETRGVGRLGDTEDTAITDLIERLDAARRCQARPA